LISFLFYWVQTRKTDRLRLLTDHNQNVNIVSPGLERNTPGMERSASSATDLYNYRYTKKQNEARSHEARSHESKRGSTPDSVKRVEECDDEVTEDSLLDGFSQEQLDFLNADQQR